jgi:diguanylate cyclase (GGDEF)-like protein
VEVIQEKCVACGLCVLECGHGAYSVRDDTDVVRGLLRSGRPCVMILATESVAALHPLAPAEVERSLEQLGFLSVESTLLGEELVAARYEKAYAKRDSLPVVRSTCPVVVEWIRRFRPALAGALAPVVPPYIAQARLVRELYPEDVAVVYAGPCFARKDEATSLEFGGVVDVAIDFIELGRMLRREPSTEGDGVAGVNRPALLKELSLTDGFPRASLESRSLTSTDVHVARGLGEIDELLHAIEGGEAAPLIVDLLMCESCIDGPAVTPEASVFAKRNIEMDEREARGVARVSTKQLLKHLPAVDLVRSFEATPVALSMPSEVELEEILAEAELAVEDGLVDCGSCGYDTCVEHAVAIFQGNSTWEMCFPHRRRELERNIERLSKSATIDPLTGLWNRSSFSERLDDELSRYQRYGSTVSLLMLDLDGFKRVNDEHGHIAGDLLLSAVGSLLKDSVRTSDMAVRYGGDEFAVVLPGTSKTDAYAVAEKLRALISRLVVSMMRDGHRVALKATVSVGVASVGESVGDATQLLEAADRALYKAKEHGRDQVRIAPD